MKVYLAGRYSRREELSEYRAALEALGIQITSRWLDGPDQRRLDTGETLGEAEEALVEQGLNSRDLMSPIALRLAGTCAQADLVDVAAADVMVCFSEGGGGRGGRHCEWGYALALNLQMILVGPREHVFHCLPNVWQIDSWPELLAQVPARLGQVFK